MRINDLRYLGTPADVNRGLRVGAILGVVFALRSALGAAQSLNRYGHSDGNPWLVGLAILLGACGAGALLGALRPLTRRLPVAMALGSLVAFPVVLALDVLRNRVTSPPGPIDWGVDVATALIVGTIGALAVRAPRIPDPPA